MRYTTLIELPATEKIMEVASGDKDFWIIDTVGNYCFLHPAKEGIHSNLNLITDKGTVYSFTLDDVESGDPDLQVVIEPSDPSSLAAAKQAQGYVVAGLAALILMAVMFSKNHAKPAAKDAAVAPVAASTDMNQRKIQELEQDLSADQRQSQQQAAAQRVGIASSSANTATVTNPSQPGVASPATQLPPPVTATEPPRDPVADAERAMTFKARFASNLVSPNDNASRPLAESTDATESTPARSPSCRRLLCSPPRLLRPRTSVRRK